MTSLRCDYSAIKRTSSAISYFIPNKVADMIMDVLLSKIPVVFVTFYFLHVKRGLSIDDAILVFGKLFSTKRKWGFKTENFKKHLVKKVVNRGQSWSKIIFQKNQINKNINTLSQNFTWDSRLQVPPMYNCILCCLATLCI